MSAILNFQKWKRLYEQTKPAKQPAAAAKTEFNEISQTELEKGTSLQKGKTTQYPGFTIIGQPGGGSATIDASTFKRGETFATQAGGVVLFKDPAIYVSSNGEGGTAMGPQYYSVQGAAPTANAGKIALINFKFTPYNKYGSTTPTKLKLLNDTITASGFIAEMFSFLEYDGQRGTDISPYYINIIKGFAQLAPGIPGLAQSIVDYNTKYKEKNAEWKMDLSNQLTSRKIFADSNAAQKWVGRNSSTLSKIFI